MRLLVLKPDTLVTPMRGCDEETSVGRVGRQKSWSDFVHQKDGKHQIPGKHQREASGKAILKRRNR